MNKNIEPEDIKFLQGVKTLAVVCNQWGDTGKGKFVDFFAGWADIIARGTGGANAGHTIFLKGKEYIFHLVPSGILTDKDGKINIIGTGVAFDPGIVFSELEILKKEGLSYDNLYFSQNAKLVLPQHLAIDRARESASKGKIGTTGRGIGPLYEDHYARIGLTLNDLLNPEMFKTKLTRNLRDKVTYLKQFDQEIIKGIMQHEHLGNGAYFDAENIFNVEAIIKAYMEYGRAFSKMIRDTDSLLRKELGKKKILLEGAQGNLLSIDIGTYPYVTSSDCSIAGLAKGVGVHESDVDLTLGIVKAFYMTRVGEGPFPTEIGGEQSEVWCGTKGITKTKETEQFGKLSVNDKDEYKQGIAIRQAGGEYGATTGRPRRTGWLDLPLLKYSMQFSGPAVILTKLDVLDESEEIKLCVAYEYTGEPYRLGEVTLNKGDKLDIAVPSDNHIMKNSKAVYKSFPGWKQKISDTQEFEKLPKELKDILDFVKKETGADPKIISVGAERNQTVVVE